MSQKHDVKFAIICPLAKEWQAACQQLEPPFSTPETEVLPTKIGTIAGQGVICVKSGKGEVETATCLQSLLDRSPVRWVLLVGVAGGFSDQDVRRGDVVIGRFVYNMEFGKLTEGEFIRRPDNDFPGDRSLLAFAEVVKDDDAGTWKSNIRIPRPDLQDNTFCNVHDGYFASMSKVVDDPDHEFYSAVRRTLPEVHAVEMEGSGAGAAISLVKCKRAVGLLMIRGISDEPTHTENRDAGSEQRKKWKAYASDAASCFARELIVEMSGGRAQSTTLAQSHDPGPVQPHQILKSLHREAEGFGCGSSEQPAIRVAVLHSTGFPKAYLNQLLLSLDQASIHYICPSSGQPRFAYAQGIRDAIEHCSHVLFLARSNNEATSGWGAYSNEIASQKQRKWLPMVAQL